MELPIQDVIYHVKSDSAEQFETYMSSLKADNKLRMLPCIKDEFDRNILHQACLYNYRNEGVAIQLWTEFNSLLDLKDNKNATAGMYACRNGMLDFIKKILSKGSSRSYHRIQPECLLYLLGNKENLEEFKFTENHYEILKLLLDSFKSNSDLNVHCGNHVTPLMLALRLGKYEVVKLLVDARAKRKDTYDAYYDVQYIPYCIRYPVYRNIEELINMESMSTQDAFEYLRVAVELKFPYSKTPVDDISYIQLRQFNRGRIHNRIKWIELLLPFVQEKKHSFEMNNLIQMSFEQDIDEITKVFVNFGVHTKLFNSGSKSYPGVTGNILFGVIDSFLYDSTALKIDCIEDILQRFGSDLIKEKNTLNQSPMHYAVHCKSEHSFRSNLNISHKPCFHLQQSMGFELRQIELMKYLISKEEDFDIDQFDSSGYNLLMRAVEGNSKAMTSFLMNQGANPQKRNSRGQNAYDKLIPGADVIKAILRKDTGVRKMESRLVMNTNNLIRKVVATKDYMNIPDSKVDMLKKTQLLLVKLTKPATRQERKLVQKEICRTAEIKDEIAKEQNLTVLRRILEAQRLLNEDTINSLQEKTEEEVVDVLVETLCDIEPDDFDALLQKLSDLNTSPTDVWGDILWKCNETHYSYTWNDIV